MRWSTQKRLEFIESRLYWEGKISRSDLTDFFEISVPQATKDIKAYTDFAPKNIHYDKSAKQYIAPQSFEPVLLTPSSERYLTRLKLLQQKEEKHKFFNGTIPPFAEMPRLQRFVDNEILRKILDVLRNKEAVYLTYQSFSGSTPSTRWITPHSLGNDGSRWHIRALCHKDRRYKDFNLGRILSVQQTKIHDFDHSIDFKWHNEVNVKIVANPKLSEALKIATERDYCMNKGFAEIGIKAAFIYYFYEEYKVNKQNPDEKNPIIIQNREEVDAQVSLLKRMTEENITRLPNTAFITDGEVKEE